jgi:molybdenum cofactor cytidylyltransferase
MMCTVLRAVVLAAGASSRMGRPKAGLPVGERGETFLSRILLTLAAVPLPDVVVVTGAAPEAVWRAAGRVRRAVRFRQNERWQEGQLSSLLAGLGVDDPLVEGALVTLVDAPFTSVETVRRIVATWRATRGAIVRPARGDVHGHPVIFDRAVFAELCAADPRIGAKAVVRARERHIVNVPVDDAGAFVDVDTAEEYQHALRELRH